MISEKMQEIATAIARKYGLDLQEKGAYLRLTMPHFDPLVIEVLHENLVYIAHFFEPDAETHVADPGITFFTGFALWVPIEVTQRIGGHRIYAVLSEDLDDIISVLPSPQADLAEFAEIWAENIVMQGWLDEGVQVVESYPF